MAASVDRFEVAPERGYVFKEKLGAGGMGLVYRAHDPVRDVDVARKLLRDVTGGAVYRFKNEFRQLANIVHRNLVSLYELHSVGQRWFFTMELVDGVDFLQYVRPHSVPVSEASAVSDEAMTRTVAGPPAPLDIDEALATLSGSQLQAARTRFERRHHARRQAIIDATLDVDRLRAALRQLCDGVAALHRAHKLHRDLKPSNVIVERGGRVVVLDFGLVADRTGQLDAGLVSGTPAYMSPEQADALQLSDASDWYSVGCMIFEALTGVVPYAGSVEQMLEGRRSGEVPHPHRLNPDAPADLAELCVRLLARAPAERPTTAQILDAVGADGGATRYDRPVAAGEVRFVGRADELAALTRAFDQVRDTKKNAGVVVRGRSGIGKSALIEHFLQQIKDAEPAPLVLAGRCYERESVPYKALDAIVDGLANHLCSLSNEEVRALVPDGIEHLVRLFRVLERVPVLSPGREGAASAGTEPTADVDPAQQRRRAADVFWRLLGRLGSARPVVLYIDDLQWDDVDSAGFLTALATHGSARGVLLVASYRAEEEETSELLRVVRDQLRDRDHERAFHIVDVAPLSEADARALVQQIAGSADDAVAGKLAADSGGSPFLLAELVRASAHPGGASDGGAVASIEEVLRQHFTRLEPSARDLLTAVCVAGRPISSTLAGRVAGLANEISAATSLRGERLARLRHDRAGVQIEPYHDRVRETILASLADGELRGWHRRLAEALEGAGEPDAEALAEHWHGGGELAKAAPHALAAARRAEAALAFGQAAHMYRLALDGAAALPDPVNALRLRLARVLANAGRGADAAEQYLLAAEGADLKLATECRVRAAEHVLTSGDIKRGLAMLSALGRELGLAVPRTQSAAMARFLWERLKLRLRGLRYRERPASSAPMKELLRIDLCHAATTVGMVDPLRGAYFAVLQLHHALEVGEPFRVARALAQEACFRGTFPKERQEARRSMQKSKEIAAALDVPWLHGWNAGVEALIAHMEGHYALCEDKSQEALAVMSTLPEVRWAVGMAEDTRVWNLHRMGAPRAAQKQYDEVLARTRDHGDKLLEHKLRSNSSRIWLAQDRVDLALRDLEQSRVYFTRWYHLRGHAEIALYRGQARAGMEQLEREVAAILKKWRRFFFVETIRVEYLWLRARMTVAAALEQASQSAALLSRGRGQLQTLVRERHRSVAAWAALVDGAVAVQTGDRERAVAQLRTVTDGEVVRDMPLCAHAAEWRLGTLVGGDEGAARVARARAWLAEEGVARPERMVEIVAPGYPER